MSRRSIRGGRRYGGSANASAAKQAAFAALLPYSWTEARSYTVDGVSGKVDSFPDLVGAGLGIRAITANHAFRQATSANQCALPAAVSALGGKLAAPFAGGQWYDSDSTGAAWKFLHDGTAAESYYVFAPRASAALNILNSEVQAATEFGMAAYFSQTGQVGYIIYNGTGTAGYDSGAVAGGLVVGTACRIGLRHATASSPQAAVYVGNTLIASGSVTAPSASNATRPARLGAAVVSNSLLLNADWALSVHFNRVLTAAERTTAFAYFALFGA